MSILVVVNLLVALMLDLVEAFMAKDMGYAYVGGQHKHNPELWCWPPT